MKNSIFGPVPDKIYLDDITYTYVKKILGTGKLYLYETHLGFSYKFEKINENKNINYDYLIRVFYQYNTNIATMEVIYIIGGANGVKFVELIHNLKTNEMYPFGDYPDDFDFTIINMLKHKTNILNELLKIDLLYVPKLDMFIK